MLAAACPLALVVAGTVPIGPPAFGLGSPTPYDCTSTLPGADVQLYMEGDTAAPLVPGRLVVGDDVHARASGVVPQVVVDHALAEGAESFRGTIEYGFSDGSLRRTMLMEIPLRSLEQQTTPSGVWFTGVGRYEAVASGDRTLLTRDSSVHLEFLRPGHASLRTTLSCRDQSLVGTTIDVVRVAAASVTALSLSPGTVSYGEAVTATAQVTLDDRATDGQVHFDVGGVLAAPWVLDASSVSTTVPLLPAGVHQVAASYVPRDSRWQVGSTAPPRTLVVEQARTRLRVSVTGKRTTRPTRVTVEVEAAHATVPTGSVRLSLRALGARHSRHRTAALEAGAVELRLGRLARGRYRVGLTYRGDSDHQRSRHVLTLRVRRG